MRWVDLQDLESTRALQEGSGIFAPWMWRIQTSHMQLVYGILERVLEEIGSPGALVQLVEQLLLVGVTVENAQCDNSFSLGQALHSPVTGGLLNLVREYISPVCGANAETCLQMLSVRRGAVEQNLRQRLPRVHPP